MRGSSPAAVAARSLADVFLGAAAAEARRPVFRGGNLEAQTATDPELVLSGPAGTGKSLAILHRIHTDAERYPGSRQLILRKTRASLTESGLVTFEEKVLPPGHPALLGARGVAAGSSGSSRGRRRASRKGMNDGRISTPV